jgi:hypothetical protein
MQEMSKKRTKQKELNNFTFKTIFKYLKKIALFRLFHSGEYENFCLLEVALCSLVDVKQRFRGHTPSVIRAMNMPIANQPTNQPKKAN